MSMTTLENAILTAAKRRFKNPKLRKKDLLEWSTAEIEARDGEVTAWIADPGCTCRSARSLTVPCPDNAIGMTRRRPSGPPSGPT